MEKEQEKINAAEQVMLTAHENEEREIDLIELFYLLWEHALQIAGCILTGCVLAFVGTYFFDYTAVSGNGKNVCCFSVQQFDC